MHVQELIKDKENDSEAGESDAEEDSGMRSLFRNRKGHHDSEDEDEDRHAKKRGGKSKQKRRSSKKSPKKTTNPTASADPFAFAAGLDTAPMGETVDPFANPLWPVPTNPRANHMNPSHPHPQIPVAQVAPNSGFDSFDNDPFAEFSNMSLYPKLDTPSHHHQQHQQQPMAQNSPFASMPLPQQQPSPLPQRDMTADILDEWPTSMH